jgi:N-acetylmuramoyl-L-alanine amidase
MRIRGNSHRFASFIVLNAPDTPSVLFETGYLSNASDVSFLASSTGRRKVARAVANAIQVHFARRIVTR